MAKDRIETYGVTLVRPEGVSVQAMRNYIKDAVSSWSGQFHPENPLRVLADEPILVSKIKEEV